MKKEELELEFEKNKRKGGVIAFEHWDYCKSKPIFVDRRARVSVEAGERWEGRVKRFKGRNYGFFLPERPVIRYCGYGDWRCGKKDCGKEVKIKKKEVKGKIVKFVIEYKGIEQQIELYGRGLILGSYGDSYSERGDNVESLRKLGLNDDEIKTIISTVLRDYHKFESTTILGRDADEILQDNEGFYVIDKKFAGAGKTEMFLSSGSDRKFKEGETVELYDRIKRRVPFENRRQFLEYKVQELQEEKNRENEEFWKDVHEKKIQALQRICQTWDAFGVPQRFIPL